MFERSARKYLCCKTPALFIKFFYCAKTSILAKKFTVTQPIVLFFKTNYCKMVVKILTLSLTSSIPYKYKANIQLL